jgi:MFS family permease
MGTITNLLRDFVSGFKGIGSMRREFWGIQMLVLLNSLAFYTIVGMAFPYFQQDLGFPDKKIGLYLGVLGTGIAIMSFLCGMLVDRIGFRNGMLLGALASFFGRAGFGLLPLLSLEANLFEPLLIATLTLMAIGEGFLQPMFASGTAHFAPPSKMNMAFKLQVIVTQIGGGIFVGLFLQTRLPDGGNSHFFFVAAGLAVLVAVVAFLFMKDESPAVEDGVVQSEKAPRISVRALLRQLVREKAFWMIMLLLLGLIGVRMAFGLNNVLYKPYYLRTIGLTAPVGYFDIINPVTIIIGLVFLIPFLKKVSTYALMFLGMLIMTGSIFMLAIPTEYFTVAWLGIVGEYTYYAKAFLQFFVFAIGEMFWSPAIKQLIMDVAPREKKSTYAGAFSLANVPVKFLPAIISGYLLARYCPKDVGEKIKAGLAYSDSPEMMFLIFGMICLSSIAFFVCFLLVRRWHKKT